MEDSLRSANAKSIANHRLADRILYGCIWNRKVVEDNLQRGRLWNKNSARQPIGLGFNFAISIAFAVVVGQRRRAVAEKCMGELVSDSAVQSDVGMSVVVEN